ncbi:twin-arginine translocation signal domain-containing protein [Halomicroarcula sp. GCM10025894]|uniref:twin-arginine translocation signal domain-containing protein n=1 Tax=Halomicroarcula sp. GCM10025894 TaxID=3252673 RepID=UPI00361C8111
MTEPTASSSDSSRSVSRRTVLGTLAAGAGVATVGSIAGAAEDYWTVVALPDTQYSARDERYVRAQTQWIGDNLTEEHIAFVSHVGDVVQNPDRPVEWEYMDRAMSTLDGAVPYATIPGDHDYMTPDDRSSSIRRYREHFGPERYRSRDWYGGSGPSDGGGT